MIEPMELMIVNRVLHNGKQAVCRTISDTCIVIMYDSGLPDMAQISDLEATPLTPELLERCGFVKEFDNRQDTWIFMQSIEGSNIIVQHYKNGEYIFIWELNFIGKPIEHLHTLQNIMKILTRKKLNIK